MADAWKRRCEYQVDRPARPGTEPLTGACRLPTVARIRWAGGEWLYACERHCLQAINAWVSIREIQDKFPAQEKAS